MKQSLEQGVKRTSTHKRKREITGQCGNIKIKSLVIYTFHQKCGGVKSRSRRWQSHATTSERWYVREWLIIVGKYAVK